MSLAAIRKRSHRLAETRVDEEIVVMQLDSGQFFSLSGTAADAWALIDGERNSTQIVDALANEYDGDRDQVGREVEAFLSRLEENGLLESD